MEYAHAQLECSAADERAKLLAAEVIGLEEKVIESSVTVSFACLFPFFFYSEGSAHCLNL